MANPSTLSVGSRVIWWAPYQPPILPSSAPTTVPASAGNATPTPIPPNVAGQPPSAFYPGMQGGGAFPGLCQSVGGAAPDFVGSTAIVHDVRGQPFPVQMGVNIASWQSGGSQPSQQHWQFVDLSA
jgi:hypothetical protein